MSTTYGLECRTHQVHSEEWLQYGSESLKHCAKIVTLADALYKKLDGIENMSRSISINLEYVGSEPIDFLRTHKTCDVWIVSEYSPSITEYDEKVEIE